jgi:hypothetical protein
MGISLSPDTNIIIEDDEELLQTAISDLEAKVDQIQTSVTQIEIKTSPLPNDPASESTLQTKLSLIKAYTDLITNDPALQTTLLLVKADTDLITAIKTKTDLIISNPSTSAALQVVHDIVDAILLDTATIPETPANEITIQASLTAISNKIVTDGALESTSQTIVGKTNNLPTNPANELTLTNVNYGLSALKTLIDLVQSNIGSFQGQTNLKTLLQALGIPDTNLKSLYTCLVTDRLDNANFGLANLKTLIDSISSLIGLSTDDETKNTIYGKLYIILNHLHPQSTFTYPNGQDSTIIQCPGGSWAGGWGNKIEFIAANLVTSPFDLHFISFTGLSANGEYEVGIWHGAPGTETLEHIIPISRTTVQAQEGRFPILTLYFAANTRITLSLRGNAAAVQQVGVKITGHKY